MNSYNLIESCIDKYLKKERTNSNLIEMYFEIGKLLYNDKNRNMYMIEVTLKEKYGLIIGFTKRNLFNILKFYSAYKDTNNLNKLKKIAWKNHLVILKKENKEELIALCIKYNMDKVMLENYIKFKTTPILNNNEIYDDTLIEFKNIVVSDKK